MNTNRSDSFSFSQRLFRGELRLQFWNAAARGLAIANSFIILTALSVYQFGLYQLVLAAVVIAESFSAGLFDDVVSNDLARGMAERNVPQSKRLFTEYAAWKAVGGIGLAIAFFFGSDIVAAYYGKDIGGFVRIASFLVALNALQALEDVFFTATVSFSGFAVRTVGEVAKIFFLIGFLSLGTLGIREVLFAAVGAGAAALAFSSFFFLREYRGRFRHVPWLRGWTLWAVLSRYSYWLYLRYAVAKFMKSARPWLVRFFLNTEAVALYALAVNLITLAQSLFPLGMLTRLLPWEVSDPKRFRFIFVRSVKYALWGGVILALAGLFIVPPVVSSILPKYAMSMAVFQAMLLTLPLYGVYKILKSVLGVLREQRLLSVRVVSEAGLVLALNAVLLPVVGLFGIAAELTLTYAWRVWLLARSLGHAYPELALRPKVFFSFDAEDRRFMQRLAASLRSPFTRSTTP